MATGTSDDERDDDLTNSTEPTGDEVDAAEETVDAEAAEDSVESEADDAEADEVAADEADAEAEPKKDAAVAASGKTKPAKRGETTTAKGASAKKSTAVETSKRASKKDAKDKGERRGLGKFFHEVIVELKKVVTPTRQELWRYVGVVLAFLVIMMVIVMILDWIFGFASSWVFGNGQSLFPEGWFQGGDPTQTPLPTESVAPSATATATP